MPEEADFVGLHKSFGIFEIPKRLSDFELIASQPVISALMILESKEKTNHHVR